MATVSRADTIAGPAKITVNNPSAATFYTQDDISVNVINETFDVVTSAHGVVDSRYDDARVEVTFTPDGQLTAAIAAVLWPYANTGVGTSIFGAADKTLTIHPLYASAELHTVKNCAITAMPDVVLSANKSAIGSCTYTGIRTLAGDWATADTLYTVAASGGTFVDTAWTPATVLTQPYTAAWGAITGFTDLHTLDGFNISFNLQIEPTVVDDLGTIDMKFTGVGCMVKFTPVGASPTMAQMLSNLSNQATGKARGRSVGTDGGDLVITGADTVTKFTLNSAGLVSAGYRFGASVLRKGELGFVSVRQFTTGAQEALWTWAFS
jgi:hypothetical protein